MKTNHSGGKIRGREIGCRALKNSTQTSSADNESEPEQLFVLAEVTLKLAHLPLTEAARCVLPDTIVFNILKFCLLLLLCITFNNWWKKWGFFSAGSSRQASSLCRWGEGERQNEWVWVNEESGAPLLGMDLSTCGSIPQSTVSQQNSNELKG